VKGKDQDAAARLFEEYVLKGPVVNKDAGHAKRNGSTRKASPSGEDDTNTLTVDLHGMTLDEAVRKADLALGQAGRSGYSKVKLITGVGKHSPGLYSPLYKGLEEHLAGRKEFAFEKKNGVFTAWLK
jgi:DNA-nicking Smr family endonuclease